MDLSNWNVRIIQSNGFVKDQLYNIYDENSIVFDENEGHFYQKDYDDVICLSHEFRSSVYPSRNYNIKESDYYSVSVSLENYIKMLKGEKDFPFSLSREERLNYDLFGIYCSVIKVPDEIKEIIESCKNQLK